MRKQKTPPFDELFEDLLESIRVRNPEKTLDKDRVSLLRNQWRGKEKNLHKLVKKLKINENKAESISNSVDEREVEFIVGHTLDGQPIIVKHVIFEKTVFEKPKGNFQKKQKSKTYQRIKAFRSLFNM